MKQKLQTLFLSAITIGALASPLAVAAPAYAADCAVLPKSWCATSTSKDANNSGVMLLLKLGIKILTAIIGIVAVGVFVYAGIMYASAGDKSDQVSRSKNLITQAVIGLVLYGLMFFALQWLVPGGIS